MSATIILAKEPTTGIIHHINDVDKQRALSFVCVSCLKEMIVVKSEARKKDWHFRHMVESTCTGGKDTALHDYGVQVLMENSAIWLSKSLYIEYSNPRKEASFFKKRSDVTVKYENEDVHFEVFVKHNLDQEKIDIYKSNKIKCIHIDLSAQYWLTASPEVIKEAVLNQIKNKTVIYWKDEPLQTKSDGDFFHKIIGGAIITIGLVYFFKKLFKLSR